jgi:hypothetical protein
LERVGFLDAFEDSSFQFIEGLDSDMAERAWYSRLNIANLFFIPSDK